ncbi:hypothetical protein V8F06_011661 [Rhypophila decipiens]
MGIQRQRELIRPTNSSFRSRSQSTRRPTRLPSRIFHLPRRQHGPVQHYFQRHAHTPAYSHRVDLAPRPTNPSITTNSSSPGTSVDLPIQCPTRSENLRLFGLTNLIVALLIVCTACRPLIRMTTGGILGAPGKWSKYYTWLISMALTIGSNALVSGLIVTTPGYEHLSMLNVFALYSSRPRINQVWTGFLRVLVGPVTLRGKGRLVQIRRKKKRGSRSKGGPKVIDTGRYGGRKWGTGNKRTELGEEIENKKGGEGMIPVMRIDPYGNGGWRWEAGTGTGNGAAVGRWGLYGSGRRLGTHDAENEDQAESQDDAGRAGPAAQEKGTSTSKSCKFWRRKAEDAAEEEEDHHVETEWIYTDSYVATSVAEFVIQLISAIFIGITWRRFPNEPIREHMKDYYNYMLAAPAMSLVGWLLIPIWRKRNRGGWNRTDISGRTDVSGRTGVFVFILFLGLSGFFTYGVAWRYWAEFLLLPGSL